MLFPHFKIMIIGVFSLLYLCYPPQLYRRGPAAVPHRRGGRVRGDGRGPRRRRRPLAAVPGDHPRGRLTAQPRQKTRQCYQLLTWYAFSNSFNLQYNVIVQNSAT